MAPSIVLVIAVAGLSHGLGRARAERVEDEDEAGPSQGNHKATECKANGCMDTLGKETCPMELKAVGKEEFCLKHHHTGGIAADPTAYGMRINFENCKDAGKDTYKYGGKAYAGGKVNPETKLWVPGCCAMTCGTCYGEPGTAKPAITAAKSPDIAKPRTPEPKAPGKIAPEIQAKPEPVAVATPKAMPAKASVPAKVDPDPSCKGEMWCREWDVVPMGKETVPSTCTDTHGGKFFESALNDKGELKKKKKVGQAWKFCSEVTAKKCQNVIQGWCCWPPTPKFPGPSGPCASIKDYYPSGNNCEKDMTCPKLYNLEVSTPGKKTVASCYPKEKGEQQCCAKPPCDDQDR